MMSRFIKFLVTKMLLVYIFILFCTLSIKVSEHKNLSDPCNDKRIVLKTVLVNNTIENRFRLICTSTLFTMSGGSSSVTWRADYRLVDDVWTEFYFFYEQSIVLRFIKILLGFEPTIISLICAFDTVSKNYSFTLWIDNTFSGTCTKTKNSYVCSAGRMHEFFRNLEHYRGGKSIVSELKVHARSLKKKWSSVCKIFKERERNATYIYSLDYNYTTNMISCSVKSNIPWQYKIFINGSVINTTKTTYNRSDNIYSTVGDTPRGDGICFLCTISPPGGKNVSRCFNVSAFTTSISTYPSIGKEYHTSFTTVNAYVTVATRKGLVQKDILIRDEIATFGTGQVTSVVIMVLLTIGLIFLFVFWKEVVLLKYNFQKVPTESPYKDVVMIIGK